MPPPDTGQVSADQPGAHRVGDRQHSQVMAWLWVAEHPDRVRVTRADGRFRFDGVPVGGHYRIHVWHESGRVGQAEADLGDRPLRLEVPLGAAPVAGAPR